MLPLFWYKWLYQLSVQLMQKSSLIALIASLLTFNLNVLVLAEEKRSQVRQPVPQKTNSEVISSGGDPALHDKSYVQKGEAKLTPIEQLQPWFADCSRRIKRKWAENQSLKQTVCTFEIANDGSLQKIKTAKGDSEVAESILLTASPFRKAPNDLPYTKKIRIEFSEYPNLSLRFN